MKSIDRRARIHLKAAMAPALAFVVAAVLPAHGMARTTSVEQRAVAAYQAGANAVRLRATQLVGQEIRSTDDADIGKISDLVINMSTGGVRYAILSLSGDIGIGGGRRYAIPVGSLKMGAKRGELIMDIDAARWKEQKSLPASGYRNEIDRMSGLPAVQPAEAYSAYRASELIGKDVQDAEGRNLGKLRDLVIDMDRQKVRYAAIEITAGRTAGKLLPFPIAAFMFPEGGNKTFDTTRLVLNVKPSQIRTMRGFTDNRWPDIDDARQTTGTDRYPSPFRSAS